jgi:hypothetical protein
MVALADGLPFPRIFIQHAHSKTFRVDFGLRSNYLHLTEHVDSWIPSEAA